MSDATLQPETTDAVEPNGQRHRLGVLRPLKIRDFRLLWTGMTVSFLGDGIYVVALAWQVYAISNTPTALSVVTFAMSVPLISLLLFSGVLSDRFDRRLVMIAGDLFRFAAVGIAATLAITGVIEVWHLVVLSAFYGVGEALFYPAFGAVVPDIVPTDLLTEANSLDGFVRNGAERLIGPALGGVLIGVFGVGWALMFDALTFLVSIAMLLLIRHRPQVVAEAPAPALQEIKEGFSYARSQPWLIATLLSALVTVLFIMGPARVLIPFVVKNELGGSAGDLGIVYTAGGIGAIVGAILLGQRGLPRRHILFLYMCFGTGVSLRLFYAFVQELWQAIALEAMTWLAFSWGQIAWMTLMHKLVPSRLRGRVTSLDWLISLGLFPVSLIAAGPLAEAIGVRETMFMAGLFGGIATFAFLLWPGVRDTERTGMSVTEVPGAGEDHGDAVLVGGGDDLLVSHGTSGLDDRGGTGGDGRV